MWTCFQRLGMSVQGPSLHVMISLILITYYLACRSSTYFFWNSNGSSLNLLWIFTSLMSHFLRTLSRHPWRFLPSESGALRIYIPWGSRVQRERESPCSSLRRHWMVALSPQTGLELPLCSSLLASFSSAGNKAAVELPESSSNGWGCWLGLCTCGRHTGTVRPMMPGRSSENTWTFSNASRIYTTLSALAFDFSVDCSPSVFRILRMENEDAEWKLKSSSCPNWGLH